MPWIPEVVFQSQDMKLFEEMIGSVKSVNKDDLEIYKYTFQSHGNCNYSYELLSEEYQFLYLHQNLFKCIFKIFDIIKE